MKRKTPKFRVGQVVRDLRKYRTRDDAWAQIIKVTRSGMLLNGRRYRTASELRPLTKRERGKP